MRPTRGWSCLGQRYARGAKGDDMTAMWEPPSAHPTPPSLDLRQSDGARVMWEPGTDLGLAGGMSPGPRPYAQLLRDNRSRRFAPALSLVIWLVAFGVWLVASAVLIVVYDLITAGFDPWSDADPEMVSTPVLLVLGCLVISALCPLALLAVRLGFDKHPRWLSSVTGEVRWAWLARCGVWSMVLLLPLGMLAGFGGSGWAPVADWPLWLVVGLVGLPLAVAGLQYTRGWLTQLVGSLPTSPRTATAVGVLLPAAVFAVPFAAAGWSWYLAAGVVALVPGWLIWRTGGLEAGLAMDTALLWLVLLIATLSGGDPVGEPSTRDSLGPFVALGIVALPIVSLAVVLERSAARRGIASWSAPATEPDLPSPART